MSVIQGTKGFLSAFLAALAFLAGIAATVHAQPPLTASTVLRLSVVSNTVSLGEPVVIHYRIFSTSAVAVYPDTFSGRYQWTDGRPNEWYHFELKNCSTGTVMLIPDLKTANFGAVLPLPSVTSNSSFDGEIVANLSNSSLVPGKYILSVQTDLSCTFGPDHLLNPQPTAAATSFPITITQGDKTRLSSEAQAWRAQVSASNDLTNRATALRLLFALPEQSAMLQWQELALDVTLPEITRVMLAEEVSRTDSFTRADLLAKLCWENPGPKHPATPVKLYLSAMWVRGDARMKSHIQELAAAHGDRMPFVPLMRLD